MTFCAILQFPEFDRFFCKHIVERLKHLNRAIEAVSGDIVVFMDIRQRVAPNSIKILRREFCGSVRVGCVSGALVLGEGRENSPHGVGSYWKMEKAIRDWESDGGSAVGATGALYAVRRSLVPHLPAGLILDDVFIPMAVARSGATSDFRTEGAGLGQPGIESEARISP